MLNFDDCDYLENLTQNCVKLPFPHSDLMPNKKTHWGKKSKIAEKAKYDAWLLSKKLHGRTGKYGLACIFLMPDNVNRDTDNLVAAMKPAFDGMAEAMRVNDAKFRGQFALKLYRRDYPKNINAGVLVFVLSSEQETFEYLAAYFDLINRLPEFQAT